MAIENIDFAKKRLDLEPTESKKKDPKQPKSKMSWFLIVFFLGFSVGFFAGFQFFKLKHIEENLIKNPDQLTEPDENLNTYKEPEKNKNQENHSEIAYANVSKGKMIVYIGKYNAKRSSEIIKYIKSKELSNRFEFYSCEGLENFQAFKSSGGIYRIPIEEGKYHKIILGCFLDKESAMDVLRELKKINENMFKETTILEIEH